MQRQRSLAVLVVFWVRAGVADLGRRHRDDLAGVGRIGEDLLVARHARREHDLTDRVAERAESVALERRSVGKDEAGRALHGCETCSPCDGR